MVFHIQRDIDFNFQWHKSINKKDPTYLETLIFFFYQQWINKIKGDTSGVSQPIYIIQKWTS